MKFINDLERSLFIKWWSGFERVQEKKKQRTLVPLFLFFWRIISQSIEFNVGFLFLLTRYIFHSILVLFAFCMIRNPGLLWVTLVHEVFFVLVCVWGCVCECGGGVWFLVCFSFFQEFSYFWSLIFCSLNTINQDGVLICLFCFCFSIYLTWCPLRYLNLESVVWCLLLILESFWVLLLQTFLLDSAFFPPLALQLHVCYTFYNCPTFLECLVCCFFYCFHSFFSLPFSWNTFYWLTDSFLGCVMYADVPIKDLFISVTVFFISSISSGLSFNMSISLLTLSTHTHVLFTCSVRDLSILIRVIVKYPLWQFQHMCIIWVWFWWLFYLFSCL